MFLKLDGIAGDSTDDQHKREINLTSFAFALGRGGDGTGSAAGVAGAAPATKGRLQTLRVDKLYDAASPKLFRAAASGQHIKSAVLTFRRSSDTDSSSSGTRSATSRSRATTRAARTATPATSARSRRRSGSPRPRST